MKQYAMHRLAQLAARVSDDAPMRQSRYSLSATIGWDTVRMIREQLDAIGIDWRKPHREQAEIRKAVARGAAVAKARAADGDA